LLLLVSFLLIANFPPLHLAFAALAGERHPQFVSSDGGFDDFEVPEKGRDLAAVEFYFDEYKKQVGQPGLLLYRGAARDWWRFWNWSDYATHRRWNYPYREPVPSEAADRGG
jgi:hypothetical protein